MNTSTTWVTTNVLQISVILEMDQTLSLLPDLCPQLLGCFLFVLFFGAVLASTMLANTGTHDPPGTFALSFQTKTLYGCGQRRADILFAGFAGLLLDAWMAVVCIIAVIIIVFAVVVFTGRHYVRFQLDLAFY